MTYYPTIGDGAQALDVGTLYKLVEGNAVLSGLDVTVDSGTFGAGDSLAVASGDTLVDGTEHSVSATAAQIDAASNNPRKDLVYVDGSGAIQVAQGQEVEAQPTGAVREHTFAPSPPDLSDTVGVPIAEIWVDPEASNLQSADVRDRRSPGRIPASVLEAIDVSDLDFDPATQPELDAHESNANAHHDEDHASRHSQGEDDPVNVEDLATNSTEDAQFFGPDGAGGVEVRGGSGGSDVAWTFDGSIAETGQTEASYSLNGTGDEYMVRLSLVAQTGISGIYLQFNGDTGDNYDYYETDGASSSDAGEINIEAGDGDEIKGELLLVPGANSVVMRFNGGVTTTTPSLTSGYYSGGGSVSSIDFGRFGTGGFDVTAEVFRRDRN